MLYRIDADWFTGGDGRTLTVVPAMAVADDVRGASPRGSWIALAYASRPLAPDSFEPLDLWRGVVLAVGTFDEIESASDALGRATDRVSAEAQAELEDRMAARRGLLAAGTFVPTDHASIRRSLELRLFRYAAEEVRAESASGVPAPERVASRSAVVA